MRPIILFLLCVLGLPSRAQLVLTKSFNQPVPGDQFVYYPLHAKDTASLPRNTGADQTWTFLSFHTPAFGFTVTDTYSIVSTSTGTYIARIPAMNISEIFETPSGPDAFEFKGIISGGILAVDFINPRRIYQYPFTYGDSYIDTYLAHLKYSASSTGTLRGVISVSATGTGTLILPERELTNVLQIKVTQKDTTTNVSSTIYSTVKYYYFHGSSKEPVLIVNYGEGRFSEALLSRNFFTDMTALTSGKMDVEIYPNPARGVLHVKRGELFRQPFSIRLYNSLGQLCLTDSSVNGQELRIDCAGWPPGFYSLVIGDGSGTETRKILIEN